jgi:hypothetical protein
MGGNARKIQKTSFVNRWFELNVKKLFEMLEFIQLSRISTEPKNFQQVMNFLKILSMTSVTPIIHGPGSEERILASRFFDMQHIRTRFSNQIPEFG